MADAQRTPGIWVFDRHIGVITPAGDSKLEIAELLTDDDYDLNGDVIGATLADGLLMAAAPELLEALQAIFAAMHPDLPGAPGSALEKARVAIAKATGAAS